MPRLQILYKKADISILVSLFLLSLVVEIIETYENFLFSYIVEVFDNIHFYRQNSLHYRNCLYYNITLTIDQSELAIMPITVTWMLMKYEIFLVKS